MPVDKTPEKNSVFFVWLNNYSGVLLKTPTKTLLIDPVDIKIRSHPKVDAVLITHEHYDHFDHRLMTELQKATDCTIIADSTSTRSLKITIPPKNLVEASVGIETKIGNVTIKAEQCKHHAATPVTFVVTSEDGLKVFHTADSLPFPEMAQIGLREQLDLVFCTVGIAQGCTPETGSEIAWLTKPKVAVPYHTNSAADQKKFVEIVRKEMPKTACLVPEVSKIYQISKGN
jgi:L-ascorbate metabolism protein UlaG (beta-lactamase superfamily)